MSKEIEKEIDEIKKTQEEGLRFHWDKVVRAYVCERCGALKIFKVNMLKHVMEHLKEGEEG